jgi:ABC-2 type transport system ATP-binding protein
LPASQRLREVEDQVSEPLVVEAVDLRKQYDGTHALRGLSFAVPAGSICGFLGRNGAGKTTTIKVLLGMTRPSSGQARVFGLRSDDVKAGVEIRRRTGFVSDDKDLYDYMAVAEMIRFTAAFYPRWRADLEQRYVRRFDLPLDRVIKTLSRGTRTRVAVLLALCRSAELLVLDEPTSGLDPAATEDVLQTIVSHVATEQATVFFSSHQIAEVDQIADRVVIIDNGRAVVSGALDDMRERFRRVQLVFDRDAPDVTAAAFRAPGVERIDRRGRVLTVLSSAGPGAVVALVEEARSLNPVSVDVVPVTLKEIFLESVKVEN